jgi:hypothetical protein
MTQTIRPGNKLITLGDLDAYLEGVRRRAMAELEKGNPVMLK